MFVFEGHAESSFPNLEPYIFKEHVFENGNYKIKVTNGTLNGLETVLVDDVE